MTITRREKIVKIVQEEAIILELTPEQAAVLSILVAQSAGSPSTSLRGVADKLIRKFDSVGCIGYKSGNPNYEEFSSSINVYWPDGSTGNRFYLDLVEKFRKI